MMIRRVESGANFCAACVLADHERPREIEGPLFRQRCRLVVCCAALMSFAAVVTMSLLNQPPKRSDRFWITPQHYHNVSQFFDKMALRLNSAEWNCPCKTSNTVSERQNDYHIVDFFVLREHGEALHVETLHHYCSTLNDSSHFNGFYESCSEILSNGFQWGGWNTRSGKTLYMNSMRTSSLNPVAFMYDACMSWAGGLSQASLYFLVSQFGKSGEKTTQLENFGKGLQVALRTCSMHSSWPPPTKDFYADQVKAADPNLIKMQLGIAMQFNWTEYMAVCAPSYCEHLKMNSGAWILFTALAQMGGFISVAVFTLRTVIWPLICFTGGWPSSLTTKSRELWVDQLLASPATCFRNRLKRLKSASF